MNSESILASTARPVRRDNSAYDGVDISSIRKIEGERKFYRALKLKFYEA